MKVITCEREGCGRSYTVPFVKPRRKPVKDSAFHLSESDYIICVCGCWDWKWRTGRGYASVRHLGKPERVSRILLGIVGDPTLDALHSCDNPRCVRRSHLRPGTKADNMRDMLDKGRGNKASGDRSGRAKIPDIEIPIIIARYASGETQTAIAKDYGVTQSQIGKIVNYKQRR